MRRLASELRARWRAFVREADAVRDASSTIASVIRAGGTAERCPPPAPTRMEMPLEGRITSRFGMRDGRLHEGVDIAQPVGAEVRSALAGIVLLACELPGYGKVVVVDHGGDLASVYGHLESISVAAADHVERARVIGTVGRTGRSFGAHLHFEVRFAGTAVDPLVFLT